MSVTSPFILDLRYKLLDACRLVITNLWPIVNTILIFLGYVIYKYGKFDFIYKTMKSAESNLKT